MKLFHLIIMFSTLFTACLPDVDDICDCSSDAVNQDCEISYDACLDETSSEYKSSSACLSHLERWTDEACNQAQSMCASTSMCI